MARRKVIIILSQATVILRGYTYEEVRCVARVLKEVDSPYVRNMEITLNSEDPYTTIRKIAEEFGQVLNVGAGTVQTYDELVLAIDAGAAFVLSPRQMSKQMLDYCKEKGVLSVPGSFTPSEIAESFANGADIVKVFPANEVSYSYAKKVCEPMGDLALMAVGGVNRANVKEVFASGYQYIGTAGGLFNKADIKAQDVEKMKESLTLFIQEL